MEVFLRNTAGYSIDHVVGRSPDIAATFPDGKFDIVYLDAEHDEASVEADIRGWRSKAKYFLAGHDYFVFHGVEAAVRGSGLKPVVTGSVWVASVGS